MPAVRAAGGVRQALKRSVAVLKHIGSFSKKPLKSDGRAASQMRAARCAAPSTALSTHAPGCVTAVGCLVALSLPSVQVPPPPSPRQSGVDCWELSRTQPVAGFSSPDQRRAVSCAEVGHA